MSIRMQMIGTGNAFARKYFNNNALIHLGDRRLMIDFGLTAPLALHRLGMDVNAVDEVLISHIHADHVGGLEELAFKMKYIYRKKPTLYIASTLVHLLWENCLKAGLVNPDEHLLSLHDYFHVVELEEKVPYSINEQFKVELIRTEHIPNKPSYSIVMNDRLYYSADSKFNRSLLEHMHHDRKCAYILHDCQLKKPGVVHATLDELLTLPEEIQSKTYLMHYDDEMESYKGLTGRMTFIEQQQIYEFD